MRLRPRLIVAAASVLAIPFGAAMAATPASAATTIVVDGDGQGSPADCDAADAASSTVQDGVNAAAPGDTVLICPGTYTEQVTVQTDVDLVGTDESGVVIKAPVALVDSTCIGNGQKVIVDICGGATVGLHTLTVSGPGPSSCGSIHFGVFVGGGATLNASDDTIQDIRDEPLSGCQNGGGLRIGSGPLGQVGHGTVDDVTVKRYQKGGIVIDGAGSDGTVTNSHVNGVGPTTATAQNGIQVSREATANIEDNAITGNECDHSSCGPGATDTSAGGLLLFQADSSTTVTGNTISGNDMGIYNLATDTDTGLLAVSDNVIAGNRYFGAYVDQGHLALTGNLIRGPSNVGVQVYSFDGSAQVASANLTDNQFTRNKTDVDVVRESSAPNVTVVARDNAFLAPANGNGVVNHTATALDMVRNYWNAASGPSDWSTGTGTKVSDNVDFFPWFTNTGLTTLAACGSPTGGNDIVCGTSGNDVINAFAGNDLIIGFAGNDTLTGAAGNDAIIGNGGDDTLNGGADADSLQGRSGTDTCNVGGGPGDRTSSC